MQQPVLEGETVDEGLQRRAGRAQRIAHVDLAGAAGVEIIGGADARAHLAALVVDRDNGDGNLRAKRAGAFQRELLQVALQTGVDGQPVHAASGLGGDDLVGGMRRQHRQRLALMRHRLRLGAGDLVARYGAGRRHAVEHAVARGAGRIREAVRPAEFRRLRQRHQQGRFGKREFSRFFAEIGQRRRAHAFQIAAIGCQREIERQDLRLAQRMLDLEGAHDLAQFCGDGAMFARLQQARHLHGQRRAAGDDVARGDELERRARHGDRIDAVMVVEALVLVCEQKLEEARIDILRRCRQPPAARGRGIGAQQMPIAGQHQMRIVHVLAERRRAERPGKAGAGERQQPERKGKADKKYMKTPPHQRFVMAGLVPAIPIDMAPYCVPKRDRRDKPGDDIILFARSRIISPPLSPPSRWPSARTDPAGTCPRPKPAAARKSQAKPRAPHRRR